MESLETTSIEAREEEEEEEEEEQDDRQSVIDGNEEEVPAPDEGVNDIASNTAAINNDTIACVVVLPATLVEDDDNMNNMTNINQEQPRDGNMDESSSSCDIPFGDVVDIDKNKKLCDRKKILILFCFLFGMIGLIVFAVLRTKKSTTTTTTSSTKTTTTVSPPPSLAPTYLIDTHWYKIFEQHGPKDLSDVLLGASVDISEDGSILAFSSGGRPSLEGRVYIIRLQQQQSQEERTNPSWTWTSITNQPIQGLNDNDASGYHISLSADGLTIAIGAIGCAYQGRCYLRVFTYAHDDYDDNIDHDWLQLGQTIDMLPEDTSFTAGLSLSGDASTIVTSRFHLSEVYVYRYNQIDQRWYQFGETISSGGNGNDSYGIDVDITYDGNIVAIGAIDFTEGNGFVEVYQCNNNSNNNKIWQQIHSPYLHGDEIGQRFGAAVRLSRDGNVLMVGATEVDSGGPGFVQRFERNINNSMDSNNNNNAPYEPVGRKLVGRYPGDNFGHSISMTTDCLTIVVGTLFGEEGIAYFESFVFEEGERDWTRQTLNLDDYSIKSQSKVEGKTFGIDNTISGDGTIVALGNMLASDTETSLGSLFVYHRGQ